MYDYSYYNELQTAEEPINEELAGEAIVEELSPAEKKKKYEDNKAKKAEIKAKMRFKAQGFTKGPNGFTFPGV